MYTVYINIFSKSYIKRRPRISAAVSKQLILKEKQRQEEIRIQPVNFQMKYTIEFCTNIRGHRVYKAS